MEKTQNYQNHVRYFPLFHFVLIPLLTLNLLYQGFCLFQDPGIDRLVWVGLSFLLILMTLAARTQSLKAQDRVIRLEERLRYKSLLSSELQKKAEDLRLGQIIALRFASDEELPALIERTLSGDFNKTKGIKLAVKNWRGDHIRV